MSFMVLELVSKNLSNMTNKKKSIFSGPLEPPKRAMGTSIISCDNCKKDIRWLSTQGVSFPLELGLIVICHDCYIKLRQIKELR
jgi:hypothetical protein